MTTQVSLLESPSAWDGRVLFIRMTWKKQTGDGNTLWRQVMNTLLSIAVEDTMASGGGCLGVHCLKEIPKQVK